MGINGIWLLNEILFLSYCFFYLINHSFLSYVVCLSNIKTTCIQFHQERPLKWLYNFVFKIVLYQISVLQFYQHSLETVLTLLMKPYISLNNISFYFLFFFWYIQIAKYTSLSSFPTCYPSSPKTLAL